jgi:hypothetical protein
VAQRKIDEKINENLKIPGSLTSPGNLLKICCNQKFDLFLNAMPTYVKMCDDMFWKNLKLNLIFGLVSKKFKWLEEAVDYLGNVHVKLHRVHTNLAGNYI